ncbi:MAG: DUF4402 domain-containing protein [Bacteroidota bacterium]
MRKTKFVFTLVCILSALNFPVKAQVSLNPTAGSKVGKAIAIDQTSSLHFGTMTVPTGAVNVVLTALNVRSASIPANISLLPQSPVHQTASYIVYGDKDKNYSITLPANNVVTISNGTSTIHVNNFTFNSASLGSGSGPHDGRTDHSGEDTFTVGATLILVAGQAYGVYNGTFTVTVDYN